MSKNDRIDEGSEISEKTEEAKPKRKGGKAAIAVGVVAAIVIVAGVGFTIWHEQPSFCNAICHDPMDPYVEGYYEENSPILSAVHQANRVACLDCHEPTLSEQVSEGIAWITGDFYTPPEMRDLATNEFCLNEACHSRDDIVSATEDWGGNDFNPHAAHTTKEQQCGDCHRVHRESVMSCSECHTSPLPEGWVEP